MSALPATDTELRDGSGPSPGRNPEGGCQPRARRGVDGAAPGARPAVRAADGVPDRPAPPSASRLSEREREVARLVIAGQTYREIGGRLYISAKTVEHHVSRMRQRLGASNRSDLLARLRAELADSA